MYSSFRVFEENLSCGFIVIPNVLIDARWLRPGMRGIGVFTHSMLTALSKIHHHNINVTVAVPVSEVVKFKIEFGDCFAIMPLPTIPDPFLDFIYFPLCLMFKKFDLIHFTGNTGILLAKSKCKVLLTVHDVSFMKNSATVPWPLKMRQVIGRIYRKLSVPIFAKNADRIVTVSKFAAQDLMLELHLKKLPDYIYHGINYSMLKNENMPSVVDVVSGKYLVIGGADPQKNINTVVQAFALLYKQQGSSAPAVVIIGLTLEEYLKFNPKDIIYPNTIFLGYLNHSHVKAAIDLTKCTIIPSFYESFGLPVIESLSAGKAVICSNLGALKEIGKNAPIYFDPSSSASLIDAIETFEAVPDRHEQISVWKSDSMSKFTWHGCAEQYYKIYLELAKDNGINEKNINY